MGGCKEAKSPTKELFLIKRCCRSKTLLDLACSFLTFFIVFTTIVILFCFLYLARIIVPNILCPKVPISVSTGKHSTPQCSTLVWCFNLNRSHVDPNHILLFCNYHHC